MYDADRLCPTEACKVLLQNNTNPPIRDLDVSSVDCLRVSHEALM